MIIMMIFIIIIITVMMGWLRRQPPLFSLAPIISLLLPTSFSLLLTRARGASALRRLEQEQERLLVNLALFVRGTDEPLAAV
jgi:hypothetical protein